MIARTDDERWRTALHDAARPSGAPLSGLARSGRRNRLFLIGTFIVVALAVGAVFAALGVGTPGSGGAAVPGWQAAVGTTVAVLGLVVQLWGVVRQLRTSRAQRLWSSPLFALTRSQRRALLRQVRGRQSVQPATVSLALLTARGLVAQRMVVVSNVGLAVLWSGLWVADPDGWRRVLIVVFVGFLAVAVPFVERDARRGSRFITRYGPAVFLPAQR